MKALAIAIASAVILWTGAAFAEPLRILVAVGSKNGLPAERPLKFADNDASRVRDVMVSLGGVRPEHATVLSEPTRAQLFGAIDRAKAEAQKHRAEEVTFFLYFSGHGDREAIHLGGDRLLITDLSAKMAEVPANLRIAVTDACRATREKGFSADEPFPISATLIPNASGQVWLHASGDGEAAQESDELRGAIFTHAWLNGLRGAADVNGDARVTLDESFAFAHSQTLIRSAKSSGVLQKPEAVVSLRESAPIVLTETLSRGATLSLPQARDGHFLVFSPSTKSVFSEVWGSPDRRLALRLPPGRYVVHKRMNGTATIAQVSLGEGEVRKLEDRDFSAAALEPIAKKGVDADAISELPPERNTAHEITAGWDAGANARTGFAHGPRVGYAYAWRRFAISVGAGMDFAERTVEGSDETLTSGFGRAGAEARFPIGRLTLRVLVGGRAGWLVQTLRPIGGGEESSKGAFAVGPEGAVFVRTPLGKTLFADVGAATNVTFLREESDVVAIPALSGVAALGARF